MIDLVIDRTETDVLLGNSKGIYQAEDLNRVGQAVEELAALLPQLDLQAAVAPKTYRGANAIEKALLQVHDRICGIQNAYQYSGAAYAGEETGL